MTEELTNEQTEFKNHAYSVIKDALELGVNFRNGSFAPNCEPCNNHQYKFEEYHGGNIARLAIEFHGPNIKTDIEDMARRLGGGDRSLDSGILEDDKNKVYFKGSKDEKGKSTIDTPYLQVVSNPVPGLNTPYTTTIEITDKGIKSDKFYKMIDGLEKIVTNLKVKGQKQTISRIPNRIENILNDIPLYDSQNQIINPEQVKSTLTQLEEVFSEKVLEIRNKITAGKGESQKDSSELPINNLINSKPTLNKVGPPYGYSRLDEIRKASLDKG